MFNKAISRGDAREAWNWMKRMPSGISLDRALQLTVCLGVANDPRYKDAADRLLERFKEEMPLADVTPEQVDELLARLGRPGPPPLKYGAGEDLRDLAARIAQQDHRELLPRLAPR